MRTGKVVKLCAGALGEVRQGITEHWDWDKGWSGGLEQFGREGAEMAELSDCVCWRGTGIEQGKDPLQSPVKVHKSGVLLYICC